jgi:hypothetical protein
MTLATEIERAKQRAQIEEFDRNEKIVAEAMGDLCTAPELMPGDAELLQPWLTWCKEAGVRHAPAKPWCVAAFILDRHRHGADEQQIHAVLGAITRLHDRFGLANPVAGPVHAALYRIFEIYPPRSWPKEDKALWATLPALVRHRITSREAERDAGLRKKQNELAAKLKELQPNANDGATPVKTEKVII